MGGRGGASHRSVSGGVYGRDPDYNGYYVPQSLREAIDRHMSLGNFDWNLWNALTQAERDGIFAYTGSAYSAINQVLFGSKAMTPRLRELIDNATSGMSKMQATFNFVATRGDRLEDMASLLKGTVAQMSDPAFLRSRIGKAFEFKGFMSSGVHQDAAWTFKGVTSIIKTPKGTHGLYVDPVSAHRGENEFLYQRGVKLMVHKIITDSNGRLKTVVFEVVTKKKK